MSKTKPKRKVCKCGWTGKTKANICPRPLCGSPLSVHREGSGKVQRDGNERVEPTPELIKRRKRGERDLVIDQLLHADIVTDIQADAYARFCWARRVYWGKCEAAIGGYGERVSAHGDGPAEERLEHAKRVDAEGVYALEVAGAGAKAAVFHLYFHNEALHLTELLIGLDALVAAYGLADKKVA